MCFLGPTSHRSSSRQHQGSQRTRNYKKQAKRRGGTEVLICRFCAVLSPLLCFLRRNLPVGCWRAPIGQLWR